MKVVIKKFKTIENKELQMPAQIKGGNGLGKTTILEAISFVFTGKNLDGKEFEQVYDNRVDLHDALADVSFFDNYGNEWARTVKPIFQTGRDGLESIKINRSTECKKNGIGCNDFSGEFIDFYKFGTDFIFQQKAADQRALFIDLLKSKLPEYNVTEAQLKLKELTKAQKEEVQEVKVLTAANKSTVDVPIPELPERLTLLNAEFIGMQKSQSSNSDAVAEINKANNEASDKYFKEKNRLNEDLSKANQSISKVDRDIASDENLLESIKSKEFEHKKPHNTKELEAKVSELKTKLNGLEYFEDLQAYATNHFNLNPICKDNSIKINELLAKEFIPTSEISSACPLSGEVCETARLNSEKSQRVSFENANNAEIESLKSQNRSILTTEMRNCNAEYLRVASDLKNAELSLNSIQTENDLLADANGKALEVFTKSKTSDIDTVTSSIKELEEKLKVLNSEKTKLEKELSLLKEPTPAKLPESLEISDELWDAHNQFEQLNKDVVGAIAINGNNTKLTAERNTQIRIKQELLLEIGTDIAKLTSDISDYFSNMKGIIKQEFAGEIDIDVQLLEYVMARDEYKDCFKITANGKVFPYECNGALQNNVKMQILFNLQRLADYTGITILDNCEANTTQEINTLGLNCVLAHATLDKELLIK